MADAARVVERVICELLNGPDFGPTLAALSDEAEGVVGDRPEGIARLVLLRLRRDPALVARLLRLPRSELEALAVAALVAEGFVPDPDSGEWRIP